MLLNFGNRKELRFWITNLHSKNKDLEILDHRIIVRNGTLFREIPYANKYGHIIKEVGYVNQTPSVFIYPKTEDMVFKLLKSSLNMGFPIQVSPSTDRVLRYAEQGIPMHIVHIIHGINAQQDVEGAYCKIESLDSNIRDDLIERFSQTPEQMWSDRALDAMSKYLYDNIGY